LLQANFVSPLAIPREWSIKLSVSESKVKLSAPYNVQFAGDPAWICGTIPEVDPNGLWESLQGFVNLFCFMASSKHKFLIRELLPLKLSIASSVLLLVWHQSSL